VPQQFHLRGQYRSRIVTIRDVRCRPGHAEPSGEETSQTHALIFARAGMYLKQLGSQTVVADVNHVLLENPGDAYRVRHPSGAGDDCTVFAFSRAVMLEAAEGLDPRARERGRWDFPAPHALVSTASCLLQHGLVRALHSGGPDPVALDECALELLRRALGRLPATRPPATRREEATAEVHRQQAGAVKELLNRHLGEPLTLADIAERVHVSAFHLARVFRRQAGVPIHVYLRRLRLRAALERLADGAEDLTRLGLELGFASHSHFTESFRREFGAPPSEIRRRWRLSQMREAGRRLAVQPGH
jgi:AraC-like DNA-binding protein